MSMVTIMYDIGDSTSMGKINAEANARQLSSQNFNVSNILAGSISDEKVIEAVAAEFKLRYGTNDNALKDNFPAIESKLRAYFKAWHEKDPNAINPSVVDKLIDQVKEVYTSQKKNKVTQNQTVVNE